MPKQKPTRLPLGRSNRRLPFERRTFLWFACLSLPAIILAGAATWLTTNSADLAALAAALSAIFYAVASALFFEQLVRPLQTLANVVGALREDDFSFRARGARRGDALGDLALEINALAGTLQQQRTSALDALTLVEQVLSSMQSPVIAFDSSGRLRLLNEAAAKLFEIGQNAKGEDAAHLGLQRLLEVADEDVYSAGGANSVTMRWSVHRTTFRLHGVPHTLLLLTDVSAALREEERLAWQRLIRVLSHEINNSLTPIHSIAATLRGRLDRDIEILSPADFRRGLAVIQDRSESLNRFLQAYQRLAKLPPPDLRPTEVAALITQVAQLEIRLTPKIRPGPAVTLLCDPDQIQQVLINLVQNGADSALNTEGSLPGHIPSVVLSWGVDAGKLILSVEDNGLGVSNAANLFVPFYTTKPNGSGIGLVLAQQIATAHHGSVSVTQNENRAGCRAQLILPI